MFESFVTERLTERKFSVWDKMTKKKLGTFKTANAITEFQKGDKVVKISKKSEDCYNGSLLFQEVDQI